MEVVTLGSLILDDIYPYPPVLQPLYAIAGGAGLYAAIAARMFFAGSRSTRIGLIVHEGRDFPDSVKSRIESLHMHTIFVDRRNSDTTRGSNVYDANGNRSFAFITPNVKIHAWMMDEMMLTSKTYHMICTPSRCLDLCREIIQARSNLQCEQPDHHAQLSRRPIIVWEPMEDCCRSSERENFLKAMKYVDVFSPNQRELLALYDIEATADPELNIQAVSIACQTLLEGTKQRAIVARCGPQGCVVVRSSCRHYLALPACHESLNGSAISQKSSMVVDPTGGGNAFLGGFCAALSSDSKVHSFTGCEAASFYGSVAASYAIEQAGVPQMSVSDGQEIWNGSNPFVRLAELIQRLEGRPGQYHGLRTFA